MSPLRYRELCDAGPRISAEDRERLENFEPQMRVMPLSVRMAYFETDVGITGFLDGEVCMR